MLHYLLCSKGHAQVRGERVAGSGNQKVTNSNFLVTELPTDVGTAETGHFEAETAVEGPGQIGTTVNILNGPESLVGQTNNTHHWTGDVQVFTCPQTQLLSQGGENTMLAVHPDSDMGGPVNLRCDNTGL